MNAIQTMSQLACKTKQFMFISLLASSCIANAEQAINPTGTDQRRLLENERNSISIFQQMADTVVNVSNMKKARTWDFSTVEVPQGSGSGFIWDQQGYIVTNYHVVEDASSLVVNFHKDEKQYKAKVVGVDPNKDIAVLKLEEKPSKLTPIQVGSSKGLLVGQKVVAIGNPFGLDHTMTTGIVSALGRSIRGIGGVKIQDMIQTDASINPGNSGGPMLDSSGKLIGMNTMIFSSSGTSAGVGFAVPVDTIKRVVPQLIQYGKVIRPALGIQALPDEYKVRFRIGKGVVIASVLEKSPAAMAGLKGMGQDAWGRIYIGDIITAIDGKEVNDLDDIYVTLEKHKIGDIVELRYQREQKGLTTKIKLTSN